MTGWSAFTDGLAGQLAVLSAGSVVIVHETRTRSPRYAQFRQLDDLLHAELVCEAALDEPSRAGAAGIQAITEAGWSPPADGAVGNWWIDTPWPATPAQYRSVAEMVVEGLRTGFGIAEPAALSYDAWDESSGNRPLDLPLLGLPRD
ncbi:TY-Chap domain-containing protein [Nocardia sp. NPDC055053]